MNTYRITHCNGTATIIKNVDEPTITDGRLIFADKDGVLFCVDAGRWRYYQRVEPE